MEWPRLFFIVIGVLGVLLSAYMLQGHYSEKESFCNINKTINCDVVNNSPYAKLFGIPVALFGVVNYLLIVGVGVGASWVARRVSVEERFVRLLFFLYALFGLLYSAYLTAIEAFVLHTYCPLCLLSALFSTAVFVVALQWWRSAPS